MTILRLIAEVKVRGIRIELEALEQAILERLGLKTAGCWGQGVESSGFKGFRV